MTDVERYLILIEGGPPSNFSAWSPDVPGCVASAATIEDCVTEMRSALVAHIGSMAAHNEALPVSSGPGVYVERATAA
jgi:predicted RNase H-like HicB family nuclease